MIMHAVAMDFHDHTQKGRKMKTILKYGTPILAGVFIPILLKFWPDPNATATKLPPTSFEVRVQPPTLKKAASPSKPTSAVVRSIVEVDIPSIPKTKDFASRIIRVNEMVKTPLSYEDGRYFSNEYRAAIAVLPAGCFAKADQAILEKADLDYDQQHYQDAACEYKQVFAEIKFK